jgi:DNA primase
MSLAEVASRSLKLRQAGREWKACCPFHQDRTPSFTIYADDSRFMCFGCGAEGDVLDFVMRQHQVRLPRAIQMLSSEGDWPTAATRTALPSMPLNDRSQRASAIWNSAQPAPGTVVEAYLRSRGIMILVPDSIRFAQLSLGQTGRMPTLVAAVSTLSGEVKGIQRTFLSVDPVGKARLPGGKVKFSLGRVLGGAIRLGPADRSLIVTEGLEDGLTLMQGLGRSVWVAAGAGMFTAMQLPESVRAIVIGADNDAAGQVAANKAADAFAAAGRQVRIMRPNPCYKDFNAQLLGQTG